MAKLCPSCERMCSDSREECDCGFVYFRAALRRVRVSVRAMKAVRSAVIRGASAKRRPAPRKGGTPSRPNLIASQVEPQIRQTRP